EPPNRCLDGTDRGMGIVEVVRLRPSAVALLHTRDVVGGQAHAEALLDLTNALFRQRSPAILPVQIVSHCSLPLEPHLESADVACLSVGFVNHQLHSPDVLMMVPRESWDLLVAAHDRLELFWRE